MYDGSMSGARMQVTTMSKPLMSVADMNDARQDVYFLASGQSCAVHRETGKVTKFIRSRDVFEIDTEIPPYRLASRRHPASVFDGRDVKLMASSHQSRCL